MLLVSGQTYVVSFSYPEEFAPVEKNTWEKIDFQYTFRGKLKNITVGKYRIL